MSTLNIKKERQLKYVHEDSIDTVKKIKHYYSESKKKHEIVGLLDELRRLFEMFMLKMLTVMVNQKKLH